MKIYEALLVNGKKFKAVKPAVYMSQDQMLKLIKMSRPFEKMFFAYYLDLEDLIPLIVKDRYSKVSFESYNENPKLFGVLCYKNKDGKLKFK